MSLKLYVVVDRRLMPGAKAAQAAHALAQLAIEFPDEFYEWDNGTIVVLEDTPEKPVSKIAESADDGDFAYAMFTEPDQLQFDTEAGYLDYGFPREFSSLAFAPNWLIQHVLLADLPTALGTETRKLRALHMEANRKRWWK